MGARILGSAHASQEAMKRIFYSTLSVILVVALAGLAIATARLPSVPAAAVPVWSHVSPVPTAPGLDGPLAVVDPPLFAARS